MSSGGADLLYLVSSADNSRAVVPVSVILPACRRVAALCKSLERVLACRPAPAEVIVHADGADPAVVDRVRREFPQVRLLVNAGPLLGPGGSRNRLVEAATQEWVANFDDDSFPRQPDYFARALELAARFPQAAILSAANASDAPRAVRFTREPMASGCGCVFRKSWFLRAGGFVPLPVAYGMEEADMGLRLHALGGLIVRDDALRVLHDKPPAESVDAELNAAVLANTALLPFLRFPVWLWPVGLLQVLQRIRYLVARGWTAGLGRGLRLTPGHLWRHRAWRQALPTRAVLSWLWLKRAPQPLSEPAAPAASSCP